jgi:hypothetical protein
MHSRHRASTHRNAVARFAIALCLLVGGTELVDAQAADPSRSNRTPAVDSIRPPLSPRRAFFYSFLAPGYSQSVFGRHKAAAGFMLFEAVAVAMIRESAADVHEARRARTDTVVVSWIDQSGQLLTAPDTITPRFADREVRSRQARVEDWIAVLVANHLLAGADAFVASHLWDVPARLGFRLRPEGATVTATLAW